jgi:hypothetical protein
VNTESANPAIAASVSDVKSSTHGCATCGAANAALDLKDRAGKVTRSALAISVENDLTIALNIDKLSESIVVSSFGPAAPSIFEPLLDRLDWPSLVAQATRLLFTSEYC